MFEIELDFEMDSGRFFFSSTKKAFDQRHVILVQTCIAAVTVPYFLR